MRPRSSTHLLAVAVLALLPSHARAAGRCGPPRGAHVLSGKDVPAVWVARAAVRVCVRGTPRRVGSAAGVRRAVANRRGQVAVVRRGRRTVVERRRAGAGRVSRRAGLAAGDRVVALAITGRGDVAAITRGRRGRTVIEVGADGPRVLDRDVRGRALGEPIASAVSWSGGRIGGGALLGRTGCALPRDVTDTLRDGTFRTAVWTVAYDDEQASTSALLWCDEREGVVRVLATGADDYGATVTTVTPVELRGPTLLWQEDLSTKYGDENTTLRVSRLGDASDRGPTSFCQACTVPSARLTSTGGILLGVGALLAEQRPRVVYVPPAGQTVVLDEGAGVDPRSPTLTGTTASWLRDGMRQTAETP